MREAAAEGARERFRPILMTSFAFIFGVSPLMVAGGAGAASRHRLGTGVFAGMLTATLVGIFFIPLFFALIRMDRRAAGTASSGDPEPGAGGRAGMSRATLLALAAAMVTAAGAVGPD